MKHFVIGTAGHIDHGKTSLVKVLTGYDTDRLREEQKRGITIELGFTYYDDPSGIRIGIVDVPGHEKFVRNMLAGVHGIDMVLMTIALDEGVMPQTKEHLNILELLGVKNGIVVLTKKDMVDEEWQELVKEDIKDQLKDTFLKDAPMVLVSSKTGEGFDELKEIISKKANEVVETESNDGGILPIDRVFSLKGVGTVVTGTQISGIFNVNDEVMIYPEGIETKIRSLQVHGEDNERSYSSQRVALNLNKVKVEDIERGSLVAYKDSLLVSDLIDAKLKLLDDSPYSIKNKTRVRFYVSSKETFARVNLLDRDVLNPGETCFLQLRLEDKISARRKDKFIIRFFSPVITIGGGEILELQASKKKRYKEDSISALKLKDGDRIESAVGIIMDHKNEFLTCDDIALHLNLDKETSLSILQSLEDEGKLEILKDNYILLRDRFKKDKENIIKVTKEYHDKFPLKLGIPVEEIRNRFYKNITPKLQDILLERLSQEEEIILDKDVLKLSTFVKSYSESDKKESKLIKDELQKENRLYKLEELSKNKDLVYALASEREIIDIHGEFLSKEFYDYSLNKLYDWFKSNDSIDVKQFRDELDTNRKTAIALLEYFDEKKITKRTEDLRTLMKRRDI